MIQVSSKYDTHTGRVKYRQRKVSHLFMFLDIVKWQKYINVGKVSEPVYVRDKHSFVSGGAN